MKYNGLEIYDIILNESDKGIKKTSLVSTPAIDSNFLYFKDDKVEENNKLQFKLSSDEKGELVGAIMIPNKPIYRNIDGYEFYVNFTEDVIKELVSKMISNGNAGLFDIQHSFDVDDSDIAIQEIWIKESEKDKSTELGFNEPIGTAFMKVKINNDVLKEQIKESWLTGFSVELDASLIEKDLLLFKEQQKKEKRMKISDVFKNTINVNGVALHFNSELGKNTYIVSEGANGEPIAYTGEFTIDNVSYGVENGICIKAEDIQLSTTDAIKNLLSEFSAVKETVESILTSKKEIEDKESELELLKTQLEKEKLEFQEMKSKINKGTTERLSSTFAKNGVDAKKWMDKF